MKLYDVTIDLSSTQLRVEANNEEEAKQKAINKYEKAIQNNEYPMAEEYWTAECEEAKE